MFRFDPRGAAPGMRGGGMDGELRRCGRVWAR